MEKVYIYRKHMRWMQKGFLIFFTPIAIGFIILGLIVDPFYIPLGVFFILYTGVFFVLLRKMTSTKISLTNEGIHYSNVSKDIIIKFEDILKVQSKSINYTGGWLVIQPRVGKPIRLTVVLEHIGEFVRELKAKLDELNLQDRYNESHLFQFYKTAAYSDQSWVRSYTFLPRFIPTVFIQVVLGITLSFWFDNELMKSLLYIALIVGLIPYLYVEFGIFARKFKSLQQDSTWELQLPDQDYSKKMMKLSYRLYLAIGVVLFAISLFLSL